MKRIVRAIADFHPARSEAGVTAIEYGLIAVLIAVIIVTGVALVGIKLGPLFTNVAGHLHITSSGSGHGSD